MTARPEAQQVDFFDRQPTSTHDLPAALPWAAHLSRTVVEGMEGSRDATQLSRWVTPELLTRLARRNALSRRLGRATGGVGVRTVRACHVRDGIVEVSAVVVVRQQVRAMALRLEGLDGRWLLTVLEMG